MAWHITALTWLIHATVGGSLFLLAGALAVRWCREPVRRIRLIELTLAGALLVPWVGLLPGLPRWSPGRVALPTPPIVPEAPAPVVVGPAAPSAPSGFVAPTADDEETIAL